jgi:hypothetical protein
MSIDNHCRECGTWIPRGYKLCARCEEEALAREERWLEEGCPKAEVRVVYDSREEEKRGKNRTNTPEN